MTELSASDYNFFYALGFALLHLIHDPGDSLRALAPSRLRDDAEGADVIAALLGRNEGAGLKSLTGFLGGTVGRPRGVKRDQAFRERRLRRLAVYQVGAQAFNALRLCRFQKASS